jgi:Protein of unknown function (DUF2442)
MSIRIINVEYIEGYRLNLEFSNEEWRTVDLTEYLHGEVFEPWKDLVFFKQVRVDFGTLIWPNDADIAPETLYAKSTPLNRAVA